MSTGKSKTEAAIAEHSMCQPGRPGPNGDSHDGSFSFDFFHKTKSDGDFLSF